MKTFYFFAGLPRSGSTVLSAILNQNPSIYVTPTSPLLDLLIANQNTWNTTPAVLANPVSDQLTNVTRAMISAMWMHRPEPIIIDKNRGWSKNMPASTILFEKEIKVIATVRDLPSIMSSWLTLIHNNPNSYLDKRIKQQGFEPTDENYMAEMWFGMVKDCMEGLVQIKKDASDRLLLINYDDLVNTPSQQLSLIENFLEIPKFTYDINNIINDTTDDDLVAWGFQGLHKIRTKLEKTSRSPQEVLGKELYNRFIKIEKDYV